MPELINEQEIIQCLKRLGEELEELKVERPIRILMIGGAYMITQIGNRERTGDVDVLVRIDRSTKDYEKLRVAASFVSIDMHVDRKWFSDGIGDLMQAVGEVPPGKLWLKHGMLEVYIPEPEYIFVLKLLAGGRTKDISDIQALLQMFGINNSQQARELLGKYFSKQALEVYAPEIQQTFDVIAKVLSFEQRG